MSAPRVLATSSASCTEASFGSPTVPMVDKGTGGKASDATWLAASSRAGETSAATGSEGGAALAGAPSGVGVTAIFRIGLCALAWLVSLSEGDCSNVMSRLH